MKQKIAGILLILISMAVIVLASQGTTPEEKDVTVVLFILPLGLFLLFTKQQVLHNQLKESTAGRGCNLARRQS